MARVSRLILTGFTFSLLLALEVSGVQGTDPRSPADVILHSGKILTVDSQFTVAEAVAVRGGNIAAVGRSEEILKLAGPGTVKIDLKGKTVIPGIIDTHRHIDISATSGYAALDPARLHAYPLVWRAIKTKDDLLGQIRLLIDKYKFAPGQWIYFVNQSGPTVSAAEQAKILLDELNRWELDKVAPNNPVAIEPGLPDYNGLLVNSKAIDLLWQKHGDFIEKYGRYWRDSQGRPEGHLEPPAVRLVKNILPRPTAEDLAPAYRLYNEEMSAMGVTTVSSMFPSYAMDVYQLLDSRGELALRVPYGEEEIFGNGEDPATALKNAKHLVGTGSEKIWITTVTPSAADGSSSRACTSVKRVSGFGTLDRWWPGGQCLMDIEFSGAQGRGAALKGNYFKEWTLHSALQGVRLSNIHVAGDRSVSQILDVVEGLQGEIRPAATAGWALDHCTFVNPADFKRAAQFGIIFSCSPKYIEDTAADVAASYGETVAHTFVLPIKSMLDAGIKVVFESDRDSYVWQDVELMITRKDKEGNTWGAKERIDRQTALRIMTRWGADYVIKGDRLGSIEPDRHADLVVLDRDFMTIPEEDISEIQPVLTMLGGKIVHLQKEFAQETSMSAAPVNAPYKELLGRRTRRR